MRLSLGWLAEFVELPGDEELTERLNLGGFEDAVVEAAGPDLAGVVVGHVVSREQHPDADRLSVCRVDTGADEPVEVVCVVPTGAKAIFCSAATLGAPQTTSSGSSAPVSTLHTERRSASGCCSREMT